MAGFLAENGGTLLVLAVVAAAVAGIIWSLRRKKKTGGQGCGCGCAGCPSKGICHPDE